MTDEVQEHILKKYSLIKKVGSGAYGHVWKVTDKKTGEVLALKKIFDAFQHSTDAQRTYREIVFLHQLNHPNIIKLYNVIKADNDKDLYLVFQFMQADLHNAIGQKILKDAHNRFILYQLVKGLKFMHSAEVIHRDLKPSNLLLNSDCNLKICDFGLARSLAIDKSQQKDVVLTEQVATRWYRAPQVLLGSNFYDKSADIWSVGCILAEVLIGKPIFPGNSTLNQLQKILSFTGKPKQQDIEQLNSQSALTMINQVNIKQKPLQQWFKSTVPQQAINLVVSMLSINPKKRPTAQQLLKHSYLSSFHKPKQQLTSKKIIQPPISDNTKLNLKQYRKLIYERIKKLYSSEKQIVGTQGLGVVNKNVDAQAKKSIDRSIGRQVSNTKKIQKKYVHSQQDQEKQHKPVMSKHESIQRPSTQAIQKKTPTHSQIMYDSNSNFYRNTKTSNSQYAASKNPTRYSSISNQKKTFYNPHNAIQKHSSSSHHSSMHQYSSAQQQEGIKKKNSLKEILKAKKQIGVQSSYNINSSMGQSVGTKSQSNFYTQMNQSQSMPSSNIKYNSNQNGYLANGASMQPSKYQNYTNQSSVPSHQSYMQQYSSYNSGYMNNNFTTSSSTMQNGYQGHSNQYSSPYQSSSFKENKVTY